MIVLSVAAAGQEQCPQRTRIPTKRLNELVSREDPAALPELRERFKEVQERAEKLLIASSLVRMKDPDLAYWTYLANEARAVVESDMPLPSLFDSHGQVVPGRRSPEFLSWCRARNCDVEAMASAAVYEVPMPIIALGAAADPRGFDILMRALESKNHLVAAEAAQGLARLQDPRAIGPIIRAARRAPRAAAGSAFGLALVQFDHPEAQAAAEELVGDKKLLQQLRERAKTQGPRAIYGF